MATTFFQDFLSKWLNPPLSYILIAIIIIIVCYFLFKKFYTPLKDHFKGEGIDYVIRELNVKQSFEKFSRKCKKGKLYYNLGKVNIERVMEVNVRQQKENSKEMENVKFILFKTGSLMSKLPIISIFSDTSYFMINKKDTYITKHKKYDEWYVNNNVFMHKFASIWICSAEGTKFLTDLIYKRTYENAREEEMNYIKRVVWYNDKYASNMTSTQLEHDLELDKYKKRIERETGVKSK